MSTNKFFEKKIITYPDSRLNNPTSEVKDFNDPTIARKLNQMCMVMHQCDGIGLAANQIGVSKSMFVWIWEEENRVIINPYVKLLDEEVNTSIEGCLSIPHRSCYVPRYERLVLGGYNKAGELLERNVEGIEARIIAHEMDHLEGITILNREVT